MTTINTITDTSTVALELSEAFGISWDPDVMAYEEPHIFKSTRNFTEVTDDAER